MRAIRYGLDQTNHVEEIRRKQHEHWLEWTVSLGLVLKFETFNIRYLGRVTHGTGLPGVISGDFRSFNAVAEMSDYLIAPSGPMTLQGVYVITHQIGVSIPIELTN